MEDNEDFIVGRPLVYCAIGIFLGIISYFTFSENFLIGVAFATSFLIISYLAMGCKNFIVIFTFFILGNLFNYIYFSIDLPKSNETIHVQIVRDNKFFKMAKLKGRYMNLMGIYDNIKEGTYIDVSGEFLREPNYPMGIIGSLKAEKYNILVQSRQGSIYDIREQAYTRFSKILGETNAGILMALCLGEDKYIDYTYKDELSYLGVVHIISVSGFHMGIIFMILGIIPSKFIQCIIAFIYVVFTGSKPSTCRAFIMIIILKFSQYVHKEYDPLSALALSSIILLSLNPYYAGNAGFILSYTSVIGIILFNNKIKLILYKLPKFLNESISICLASMSISSLYSIVIFGELSIGSIIGNVFLIPLYSLVTILGSISIIFFYTEFIFDSLNYMILGGLTINNLIKDFLMKVTLPPINLEYYHIIFILILALSYAMNKKGKKEAKIVPFIALWCFCLFFNRL